MTTERSAGYLSLLHLKQLPAYQYSKLIKHFGSLTAIARADDESLAQSGLDRAQRNAVRKSLESKSITGETEDSLGWLEAAENHHLIDFEDQLYPTLLREIDQPPPLLFVAGNPACLNFPQVAIVGSRNASFQGKQTASWIARELASAGLTVCSGLANGIDTQAHQGALAIDGGYTVAVMGTGADLVYPVRNKKLAARIEAAGTLVSEFKLGSPPIANHFPRRNRIISGMSLGVVVIEAALKSGSLITARLALEQNREVFAVPGSIQNPLAAGCHRLIKEGAKLVDSVDAIIEELSSLFSLQLKQTRARLTNTEQTAGTEVRQSLNKEEKKLLKAIGHGECPIDTLVTRTTMDVETIGGLLTGLELKGLITRQSGRFRRVEKVLQVVAD